MNVEGREVEVDSDDVIIVERPREGWSVLNEQGETVALDLELDDELIRAGLAREAIRLIQDARKQSDFDVSDRISLVWQADGEMGLAMREHSAVIAEEVLATTIEAGVVDGGFRDDEFGLTFMVTKTN